MSNLFERVKTFFAPNSDGAELSKDSLKLLIEQTRADPLKGLGFISQDDHIVDVICAHWKIAAANLLQRHGLRPKGQLPLTPVPQKLTPMQAASAAAQMQAPAPAKSAGA